MKTPNMSSLMLAFLACFPSASLAFTTPVAPAFSRQSPLLRVATTTASSNSVTSGDNIVNEISLDNPLRVIIAGAGVGGLSLASSLRDVPHVHCTVLERTEEFRRFGGPIQIASNAMEVLKVMDRDVFDDVLEKFTYTGDKENGIKDGIRNDWYAKFDLGGPAKARGMTYTGVIDRPDLQQIMLDSIRSQDPDGVRNGNAVVDYRTQQDGSVAVSLEDGSVLEGDVLLGADGIWSAIRAKMRNEPMKGEGSGASYSGYTVFAGELAYDSFDAGAVGYKVYIGPGQYFVITDIGNGNYQWYAFLARPPDSAKTVEKPEGSSLYLQGIFEGWSEDIHHILRATKEDEIAQRDLYDRPPSVLKPWTDGNVALMGDAVHAMMPNLGQGGCQAIEDAYVLREELMNLKSRSDVAFGLEQYRKRRLIRSAAVQGLSRFASDIIIRGFDTPVKIVTKPEFRIENFNYAGIVTRMLQPILPIFFSVQFNFLYDGWKNEAAVDLNAAVGFLFVGGFILLLGGGTLGEAGILGGLGADALFSGETIGGLEGLDELFAQFTNFL
uniref:FAD-binding domain-containing protein n=1 Tax=Corethron hystrix TaxID=216773 RepID=A0A7S1B702_9STRA|mmetsp:Transcript_15035/g.33514  ORF Transcript_15035/g.33514 Transcript_15035/m.33514 type:complete len:553 (+) Transcript_15035:168-1826(+)